MEVTNNIYNSYIKPILKYGGEILNTIDNRLLKKVESWQNNCLRLVAGAVKTMPINALLVATDNLLMELEYGIKSLSLYNKLQADINRHTWFHQLPSDNKLKTQINFKQQLEMIGLILVKNVSHSWQ